MQRIEVFSTDTDDGTISVIGKDSAGHHEMLKQIPVGNAPRGSVKFTKDGRGFVSNTSQNTVSELDPISLSETRKITVGFGPRGLGITPDNKYLIVSNSGENSVSIVDLALNAEVRKIETGRDPRHMAITADGNTAYVCIWGAGNIAKIDISGLSIDNYEAVKIVDTIDVGNDAHPYSAAIHPSRGLLFVANTQADYASVINMNTQERTDVPLGAIGGRAISFTTDEQYALVSVETVNEVVAIDVDTLQATRRIPVGPGPRGIAVDPDDEILYVTNFNRNKPTFMRVPGGPNMLTAVKLNSASLEREDGDEFETFAVEVGYGPCSVSIVDTSKVEAHRSEHRLAGAH